MEEKGNKETLVISGLAGRFPECENFEQLREALLNGVDLVTVDDRRYPAGIWGTPKPLGKLPRLDQFDPSFFGIHPKQANFMDPRHRMLLETVYECIVDSGYNPKELRGSRTGVYVGLASFTEMTELRKNPTDGYTNIGFSLAMAANRVSYCFDLTGPSYSIDTACSSSMTAFVNAVNDIKIGEIESALVCGVHLVVDPFESLEFHRLNMLSPSGRCQVFDVNRDGYVRSEACVCYFIQKEKVSRRIYATVMGAKIKVDGWTAEGITVPSSDIQLIMMKELYEKEKIDPSQVYYVEAHGTGTPIGDIQECHALVKMFCQNRSKPLPIGAVKSNMGHSEVSSGLCSIAKVLISMETGIIPANLHTGNIDNKLPGISEKKLQVITKNMPWNGGVVGVNSFGFGGANVHVVLKSHTKEKSKSYKLPKNRLVVCSGRTIEGVNHLLEEIKANPDPELFALIDELHKINMSGHNYRGYALLGDTVTTEHDRYSKNRPIWFIYTGMGSQWVKMGKDLMRIEVFRKSLNRCAAALAPYGVDLIDIVTNSSPSTFDDIGNCFCAIGAVEIAMTDVLHSLGIFPDGIAGHSLGEVGCSYADGQITTEQAALLAYARGYASKNTKLIHGQMAAVGLSKEELLKILPEDIYIACQNSRTSMTISGPHESTNAFVKKLTDQGIFARLVKSADIAFHTKYIGDAGDLLLDFCKKVLTDPKPRSSKWVSSSVPPSKQDEHWAKYNCAEYHHNNFCNPVLFDQVYEHIPENAIVIEVAPHGLLQAILKRELGPDTTHISLGNRSCEDNERFFLSAIGKIFVAGGQPQLRNLYNEVQFPVGRGTKMVSPMVKWDHSISWYVPSWKNKDCFGEVISIDLSTEQYSFLANHDIDGRVLMPATGYLEMVWSVFAKLHLKEIEEFPVVLEKIKLKRASVLPHGEVVKFLVNIMKQSGYFEIFEGGSVVVTGTIRVPKDISSEFSEDSPVTGNNCYLMMKKEDLYKECRMRKYLYKGPFQRITECDVHGNHGKIEWSSNFTIFLDTMLHINVISQSDRALMLPTSICQVTIDPVKHLKLGDTKKEIPVTYDHDLNIIKSGGVEFIGVETSKAPLRQSSHSDPLLETCEFIHYDSPENEYDLDKSLNIALEIISQNTTGLIKQIKICEVAPSDTDELHKKLAEKINRLILAEVDTCKCEPHEINSEYDVIALSNEVDIKLESLAEHLTTTGFILYKGSYREDQTSTLQIIFRSTAGEDGLFLLRPRFEFPANYAVVNIRNSDFDWLDKLKALLKTEEGKVVYLFSQGEEMNGIMGLMKCLLAEPSLLTFRAIFVDQETDTFSIDDDFYREQLKKNLTFNILRNNDWGTVVHLPLLQVEQKPVGNAALGISSVGDLSTLNWEERPLSSIKIFNDSELIYNFYCALNFKDVMIASGKLHITDDINIPTAPDINIGLEYSGITDSGRRVMGLLGYEAMSLQVQSDPAFLWDIPDSWSLRDAATVPCVYATSYYALIVKGKMVPGESILIHAGTGGVGMASIWIALSMGCKVFTTVGSQEKRDYIKKMFPKLEDRNIGNSRDASFEKMIMKNTKRRGVDLVLNSLSGELFQASLRCVAKHGRFLEIGKVDLSNGTLIDSKVFLRNCSFHSVQLNEYINSKSLCKKELHNLVKEGISYGVVKPLPSTVFSETEVEEAFRFLSSGKHKGKVLIEVRKENPATLRSPCRKMTAIPKIYFDPNKTYILIGGLGGVGLEMVHWLVSKGATKIILNSRRTISTGYQSYCFKKWSQYKDVIIDISTDDTTTIKGATELITKAEKLGPVGGIFNLALVLRDAMLLNQTKSNFEDVFRVKIVSGQNMDIVSRERCKELDHFVVFSSIACGRGNIGQVNYGMANSALERLCEKRRRENLPGLAIQWGPIADVGILERAGVDDKIFNYLVPQNITCCFNSMEKFMIQSTIVGSSTVLADRSGKSTMRVTRSPVEAVAHIMGIKNLDLVDKSLTLSELGLDSLMLAETKQTLYRNYQIELETDEIRDLTLEHLISLGIEKNEASTPENPGKIEEYVYPQKRNIMVVDEGVVKLKNSKAFKKNVFLLHPIEGSINDLIPIAKDIKANVYGLQDAKDNECDNIPNIARSYIKHVKNIQPKGPYLFCGYSFGGVLSLEMANQLESEGEVVDIVSIEGSTQFVKNTLEPGFARVGKSVDKAKLAILGSFCSYFPEVSQQEVIACLSGSQSFESKLQDASKLISKKTGIDSNEIAMSLIKYERRCAAAYHYEPKSIFKGKIVLIRRVNNPFEKSEHYGLQKQCQQPVSIIKLEGNHETLVKGDNIPKISGILNDFFTLP
nr:fatty acid synthase-like [Leptinotarsa decemlineata]